jgi:hypothetical protein
MKQHKTEQSAMDEFRAAYEFATRNRPKIDPRVAMFKSFWNRNYGYISLELTDSQIVDYVTSAPSISQAADRAADFLLANGLSEVQE